MHIKRDKIIFALIQFIVFLILVSGILSIQKYENVQDALKEYPQQDKRNGKAPKYIYFKLFKEREKEMDYFSRILYQFMSTMGVRPYFVNLKDTILLGIVPIQAEIDTQVILDTFKEVVESIEITTKMKK
jgi:hypothetical protein